MTKIHSVNARGFAKIEFQDLYGDQCNIQESGIVAPRAIWLGLQSANPQVMATDAPKCGIQTTKTTGWVPFPIPEEVFLSTRMHLDAERAKELIVILQHWVDNGLLPDK